jgi:hypothetical protein
MIIAKLKVTNPDKCPDDVDISGLKFKRHIMAFEGDVIVNDKTYTGQHGTFDFEQEYGFQIIAYETEQ